MTPMVVKTHKLRDKEVNDMLKLSENWEGPVCSGLAVGPTLDRSEPGWCEKTQVYAVFRKEAFPRVPLEPTEEQARGALALFEDLVKDFPFDDGDNGVSKAVCLSAMLCAPIIPQSQCIPLHAFDASEANSGKTKLALISVMIANMTSSVPTLTYTPDAAEWEKRLGSQYRKGQPSFVVDNVSHDITGDFWCTAISESRADMRILGASELVTIDTRQMPVVTGNNLRFRGDIATRAVVCRLVRKKDSSTAYDVDPVKVVASDPGKYYAASLTVLRWARSQTAHVSLKGSMRSGSADDWDLVRRALVGLGYQDPLLSQKSHVHDSEFEEDERLALGLAAKFGDKAFTVGDVTQSEFDGFRPDFNPKLILSQNGVLAPNNQISRRVGRLVDNHSFKGVRLSRAKNSYTNVWEYSFTIDQDVFDQPVHDEIQPPKHLGDDVPF